MLALSTEMIYHRVEISIFSNLEGSIQPLTKTFLVIIEMAEYRHPKSKSSRSFREEESKRSKSKKSRPHKEELKEYRMESKTPPLPPSSCTGIEDLNHLLKKRESIKKELKRIADYPKNGLGKIDNKSKYTYGKDKLPAKRKRSCDDNNTGNLKKSKRMVASPDHNNDDSHIDSEDEENIIEERRKQRKKLLENFIKSQDKPENEEDNELKHLQDHSEQKECTRKNNVSEIKTYNKEVPDMFSETNEFGTNKVSDHVKQDNESNTQLTDNWDDSDGYYNTKIGDILDNRYSIKSVLGQGVFANVVRAEDTKNCKDVAIKIIRNNDMMQKIGLKEISVLKDISNADEENKYHCIKFLTYFRHKGHLCLVLEPMHMDLRGVVKKYGRRGLNMKALISYSRQLILALRLLKKLGIIHADIKPDNILVNEKKNILKLCDFGSSTRIEDNDLTPYLVSRFYRAPEIILGIPYSHGVDMWSVGCTIFEMASGKILFTGSSNNKMLKCFMDFKGKIPSRLLRKGKFKDQHFNYNNNFLLHKKDEATGREKVVEISNITATKDLYAELKKVCKNLTATEDKKMQQLKDFLEKIFMFDDKQRLSIVECLKHSFIQEEL